MSSVSSMPEPLTSRRGPADAQVEVVLPWVAAGVSLQDAAARGREALLAADEALQRVVRRRVAQGDLARVGRHEHQVVAGNTVPIGIAIRSGWSGVDHPAIRRAGKAGVEHREVEAIRKVHRPGQRHLARHIEERSSHVAVRNGARADRGELVIGEGLARCRRDLVGGVRVGVCRVHLEVVREVLLHLDRAGERLPFRRVGVEHRTGDRRGAPHHRRPPVGRVEGAVDGAAFARGGGVLRNVGVLQVDLVHLLRVIAVEREHEAAGKPLVEAERGPEVLRILEVRVEVVHLAGHPRRECRYGTRSAAPRDRP